MPLSLSRALGVWCFCAASAAFFTPAHAEPVPAAALAPAIPHNWTGFYLGGHVGGGLAGVDSSLPLDQFGLTGTRRLTNSDAPGWLGGGQLGFDWQAGWIVVGVEGSLSSVGIEGSTRCFGGVLICKADASWLGTVTGRLGGVIGDNMLVYVTAGAARRSMGFSATGNVLGVPFSAAGTDTRNGRVVGAGGRYAFSKNWIGFVEYNYADFGEDAVSLKLNPALGSLHQDDRECRRPRSPDQSRRELPVLETQNATATNAMHQRPPGLRSCATAPR